MLIEINSKKICVPDIYFRNKIPVIIEPSYILMIISEAYVIAKTDKINEYIITFAEELKNADVYWYNLNIVKYTVNPSTIYNPCKDIKICSVIRHTVGTMDLKLPNPNMLSVKGKSAVSIHHSSIVSHMGLPKVSHNNFEIGVYLLNGFTYMRWYENKSKIKKMRFLGLPKDFIYSEPTPKNLELTIG